MKRRNFLISTAALAAPALSMAQGKVSTIVVPYGAGGSLDFAARLLADQLHAVLGRTFIVENKAGANGLIGTRYVQAAAPDGNTLLFNGPNIVTLPVMQVGANYDPFKDFTPISCFGRVEYFLVATGSTGAKSVADLIQFARGRPDGLLAGNAGTGSIGHMLAAAFAKNAGIKVTHVPYKGAGEVMRAVTAGEVHMQLTTTSAALEKLAQAGRVNYLAVASETRSMFARDVPTIRETVPSMLALDSWSALFGPAGMSPDLVRSLTDATRTAMAKAEVVAQLGAQFIGPLHLNGQELTKLMEKSGEAQKRLRHDSEMTGT